MATDLTINHAEFAPLNVCNLPLYMSLLYYDNCDPLNILSSIYNTANACRYIHTCTLIEWFYYKKNAGTLELILSFSIGVWNHLLFCSHMEVHKSYTGC